MDGHKQGKHTPPGAQPFWNHRTYHYKGAKVIIHTYLHISMQPQMLQLVHGSHLGVEKCKRRARDVIFRPGNEQANCLQVPNLFRETTQRNHSCHIPSNIAVHSQLTGIHTLKPAVLDDVWIPVSWQESVHSQLTGIHTPKPAVLDHVWIPVSWECTAGVTEPTLHSPFCFRELVILVLLLW